MTLLYVKKGPRHSTIAIVICACASINRVVCTCRNAYISPPSICGRTVELYKLTKQQRQQQQQQSMYWGRGVAGGRATLIHMAQGSGWTAQGGRRNMNEYYSPGKWNVYTRIWIYMCSAKTIKCHHHTHTHKRGPTHTVPQHIRRTKKWNPFWMFPSFGVLWFGLPGTFIPI